MAGTLPPQPHVVIVGAGFGGLYAARALRRAPVRITIVDKSNHHCFQPLLYQVATAGLAATQIAQPVRKILRRQANAAVQMAEVTRIDKAAKTVTLHDSARLDYDYLILATGVTHGYYGQDQWAPHAPGLKTLADAIDIRRRVLTAFERAEREPDEAKRRAFLTFVVVGGGPTGVELAGALCEIARHTLVGEFRSIDPTKTEVVLVEAGDRLLAGFEPASSASAREQLERLGATLRLGARVTHIDDLGVRIGDEALPARTVLWGAGVLGTPLGAQLGAPLDAVGRVVVEPDLTIPGCPEVFVIGDLAAMTRRDGRPVPGVAPAAIQGGSYAAKCIRADVAGHERPREPFSYFDKGHLATIGRKAAVAEIAGRRFSGLFAWLVWAFVHLLYLIGFRNRLVTFLDWTWSYLAWGRGARVVLERPVDSPSAALPPEPSVEPPVK